MSSLLASMANANEITASAKDEFSKWCQANAPWMSIAYGQLGVREVAGKGSDVKIKEYLNSCWHTAAGKYPDIDLNDDSTPWCSAFVGWCLLRAGIKGTGSTWSRSWLKWRGGMHLGKDVSSAPIGSIVVMSRGDPGKEQGHVTFLWSLAGGKPQYLGGNQGDGTLSNHKSDRVSIAHYPNEVLQCIWPLQAIGPIPEAWSEGRMA